MRRPAPIGTEVGLYVDLVESVAIGDVIETRSGRRYGVTEVRVQTRGKNAGRQHLRAVVLASSLDVEPTTTKTHRIRWYARRKGSARAGITRRGSR